MTKVIIYEQDSGVVAIVHPTEEAVAIYGIEAIAQKDVPAGKPYKIIDASEIPADLTFRDAWEADLSNPHGYGIGAEAWFAEQAAKEQA